MKSGLLWSRPREDFCKLWGGLWNLHVHTWDGWRTSGEEQQACWYTLAHGHSSPSMSWESPCAFRSSANPGLKATGCRSQLELYGNLQANRCKS